MKKTILKSSLVIVLVGVFLVVLEGAAQLYVYRIAKRGKLFQPDALTGWSVKPHLSMQRKNADGDLWTIRTDGRGFRGDSAWDPNRPRAVILGDSFAFGEGVDLDDRFDTAIEELGYSVVNTGVMGYGTDQQFLKAEPYMAQLGAGDAIIVLTYYNDFHDVVRRQQASRAKPWYEIVDGRLRLHRPEITTREILRDKSYIYAILSSAMARREEITDADIVRASNIYRMIIEDEAREVASRGVNVVLAYHGSSIVENPTHRRQIEQTLVATCENRLVHCLGIDEYFDADSDGEYFLADGHWNARGHEAAGALLAEELTRSAGR